MKSRKNQNAAIRRPEILEGYYNVLVEEGLEDASLSKIAKKLDIHTSLIFHYFQRFSLQWSRTVDPGVHFGFYYQSFRDGGTLARLRKMFTWLRDYLEEQLDIFNEKGIVTVSDRRGAADFIVTLMEGLEFHAQFLSENRPFEDFAETAKRSLLTLLRTGHF